MVKGPTCYCFNFYASEMVSTYIGFYFQTQCAISHTVGIGLLIQNHKGEVMAASCDRINKASNALWTAADVTRKTTFLSKQLFY